MSTFDDFMIGEAVEKNQQIAKLEQENADLRRKLAEAVHATASHERHDEHEFSQCCSDVIVLKAQLAEVREALRESVKLQSHYAMLLNGWDGGERRQFSSEQEWIDRLAELRNKNPEKP